MIAPGAGARSRPSGKPFSPDSFCPGKHLSSTNPFGYRHDPTIAIPEGPDTATPPSGRVGRSVCGRVLLYTQGMEIDPILGLELALHSLRRSGAVPAPETVRTGVNTASAGSSPQGENIAPAVAMRELHALLRERNIGFRMTGRDGQKLSSAPPMRRRAMLAEEMDFTPLRSALKKLFRRLSGADTDEKRKSAR